MALERYILDTHCLIWFQENNSQIPQNILELIKDSNNIILFSQISLFELAIKQRIGKIPHFLATIEDVYSQAIADGFTFLNIQNSHIYSYYHIPFFENHRDPFDRLLIATAAVENTIIVTADEKFKLYSDVAVIW